MSESAAQTIEHSSATATVMFFVGSFMNFFDENYKAVIAICAIITMIVTVVSAYYRIQLNRKQLRRKDDVKGDE